ncbi:MAG: hypothetical protein ACI4PU_07275 [Intestinibacter sp.]
MSKKLNLSEKEKYEIAKSLKDAIYDMDSLNSINREVAHTKFREISSLLGEENTNKLLDEFTIWSKYSNKSRRSVYLRLIDGILIQVMFGTKFTITEEEMLGAFHMPKTKWLVNILYNM